MDVEGPAILFLGLTCILAAIVGKTREKDPLSGFKRIGVAVVGVLGLGAGGAVEILALSGGPAISAPSPPTTTTVPGQKFTLNHKYIIPGVVGPNANSQTWFVVNPNAPPNDSTDLFVDIYGDPTWNINVPLSPAMGSVIKAFGSQENVIKWATANLKPST